MTATAKKKHAFSPPKTPGAADIVGQVRLSFRRRNRLATVLGMVLGGFVPVASFVLAHQEIVPGKSMLFQVPCWLVVGGLTYSAKTVFDWARAAFSLRLKALGFVVLLEGVMTGANTTWLAYAALAILVAINSISAGCQLAVRTKV